MATLDIVIVRKNEPIDQLARSMDMLAMQRNVKFLNFRVVLMQMERKYKNDVDFSSFVKRYPFEIEVRETELKTVADARNDAIRRSGARWIMFMEYGDMFSDIYSMSMLFNLIPTDEWDVIWMQQYSEYKFNDQNIFVRILDDGDTSISGKVFRRKFITDNEIMFNSTLRNGSEKVFFATAMSMTEYTRYGKLKTRFIPYAHLYYRRNEAKPLSFDILNDLNRINLIRVEEIGKHIKNYHYVNAILKTMTDAYYILNIGNPIPEMKKIRDEVVRFYHEHKNIIDRTRKEDLEISLDDSEKEMLRMIQDAYNEYGYELYYTVENKPYTQWLKELDAEWEEPERAKNDGNIVELFSGSDRVGEVAVPEKEEKKTAGDGKAVVFCGTRNVYDDMETSAKSLMAHTKIDRVYFLIEDDEFPRELPENFTVINVKNQEFFPKDGKNYETNWTYMCLMRAAFSKILQDEHKVLSLDCDIIVNEDISELWDIGMGGSYLAGVPETDRVSRDGLPYINFGVVMMNLDLIREDGIDDIVIDSLNKDKWGCPEQDAFNHFCCERIVSLDPMYNATRAGRITGETDREKIAHYAGIRYWKHYESVRKYAQMTWDEVDKARQGWE